MRMTPKAIRRSSGSPTWKQERFRPVSSQPPTMWIAPPDPDSNCSAVPIITGTKQY
ncbi:hypothetical protein EJ05DRAFT_377005 [Pseudovirgaria hyperparasitica]|uniref:Uncharacterized protein n=1 Tax=Pseudovirgaria hyperparasitica TaxID=470096 RepID=A0A6A6W653_9PEZI|nr:uncharacterized protein EJ05DRAFT_377005 [Pseudovirgaria hyperparasitica]KAF2758093.1 hypothetical protein EJ05DRAFT_377005 [Pseudovirgaria hyperparasitica]